jgi:hypothetical protein
MSENGYQDVRPPTEIELAKVVIETIQAVAIHCNSQILTLDAVYKYELAVREYGHDDARSKELREARDTTIKEGDEVSSIYSENLEVFLLAVRHFHDYSDFVERIHHDSDKDERDE